MTITLFGKGQPTKEEYLMAYNVGKKIGEKGYILKNGAYGGIMEASAKGCVEVGGHVIGVGVEGHKVDKLGRPNEFNTQVIVKDTRYERIQELIDTDMIIVLSGQIGTLEEMFIAWINSMEKNKKPLIIFGEKMIKLVDFLEEFNYIKQHQFKHIKKIRTLEEIDFLV